MERGPIRTANGEHWSERGDLGVERLNGDDSDPRIRQKLNHGWNGRDGF